MGIRLGMHADNWRGQSGSFNDAVASAAKHGLKYLEAGTVFGYYFVSSLGYDPSLSILDNPYPIRRLLEKNGLQLSMLDASYPIFGPQGSYYGIPYYTQVIRYAKELGAPRSTVLILDLPPICRAMKCLKSQSATIPRY